jgi:hypothetical protein
MQKYYEDCRPKSEIVIVIASQPDIGFENYELGLVLDTDGWITVIHSITSEEGWSDQRRIHSFCATYAV